MFFIFLIKIYIVDIIILKKFKDLKFTILQLSRHSLFRTKDRRKYKEQ